MVWTHPITRDQPLRDDERQCRRCGRAFLPDGPRRAYCSPACSAQPVKTERGRARKREADRVRGAKRSTADRGYDAAHRRTRAELLPEAIGTLCPLCGRVMTDYQLLDLDHIVPLGIGGRVGGASRIVHARCNRSRGDTTRRKRRSKRSVDPTSQIW